MAKRGSAGHFVYSNMSTTKSVAALHEKRCSFARAATTIPHASSTCNATDSPHSSALKVVHTAVALDAPDLGGVVIRARGQPGAAGVPLK
eukprot:727225-Pelagomonas_calceolata.AAC.3